MTMRALAATFFSENRAVSFGALAPKDNLRLLDAEPWGVPAELLPVEKHAELVEQYYALNRLAFGKLPLARWVLSDLFLMPGAIGVLLGPASMQSEDARQASGVRDGDRAILAAYVGAPSIEPGRFIGVSLISFAHGVGAGAWVKALTLKTLRARSVRGIAQWDSPSVRVHARLGALRIVGRVPGGHELADRTFVYDCDVTDDRAIERAMRRAPHEEPTRKIHSNDGEALRRILDDADAGRAWRLVPPAVDAENRLLFVGG